MTGGIDVTALDWMSAGVAIELLFFVLIGAFLTTVALMERYVYWYFAASAAWVILALHELRLADAASPHWAVGILAILLAILMLFLPWVREDVKDEGKGYLNRLDSDGKPEELDPTRSGDDEDLDDWFKKKRGRTLD